jgi:hypothetical protein
MPETLEKEIIAYKNNLKTLLQNAGKYAVFSGDEMIGVYETYDEALKAGYEKAKLTPFLVKKITGTELVTFV